jgi:hypothetical protein
MFNPARSEKEAIMKNEEFDIFVLKYELQFA